MIVLDASVAVKLLVVERDSEQARTWLRNTADELVAPDLFAVETAQAIVRRVNNRQMDATTAQAVLDVWRHVLGGGVTLLRSKLVQIETAADLAMKLGHPIKDCIYLALAIDLDCDLVTCDAKFRDRAAALYARVKLLAEFS